MPSTGTAERDIRNHGFVACALAVLSVAAPAGTQTIKKAPTTADMEADSAIQHFRLGVEFYRLGNFDAAQAIDFEERFLAGKRVELTADETDQARGRLLRLRDIQSSKAPHPVVGTRARDSPHGAASAASARGGIAHARCGDRADGRRRRGAGHWHRLRMVDCTGALSAGVRLASGQTFTLREIDDLKAHGESLNA